MCSSDLEDLRVLEEVVLGGFSALADELAVVGDPGALLLEDLVLDAEVEAIEEWLDRMDGEFDV